MRRRGRHGEAGRSLAELIVALAASTFVALVAIGFQLSGSRWYQSDRNTAEALQPVRDAADYIARDLRVARNVECCTDGKLVLHQKREVNLYTVTYRLESGKLLRSTVKDYDSLTAAESTVVTGLIRFEPSLDGGAVVILLGAESGIPSPVAREVTLKLVPRMGVMP